MAVNAKFIRGNLVYYGGHQARWLAAIGPTAQHWELRAMDCQNFGTTGTDPRGYVTTVVEAGGSSEIVASDEIGLVTEWLTGTQDNDGMNVIAVGEAFQLTTTRSVYFGCRITADEATQSDFWIGLANSISGGNPVTDLLGGVADSVRFQKVDAATGISCVTEKNTTETTTASVHTFANNTLVTLEFFWDGATVRFFADGVQVANHSTNVPDDEPMSPAIQWLAGSNNVKTLKFAWARCIGVG
jgi:hypothetical protein